MPYKFDWDNAKDTTREFELKDIPGWVNLTIEYTYKMYRPGENDLYWHIKGTDHTWVVPGKNVVSDVKDPEKFFKGCLVEFKKELEEWAQMIKDGDYEDWMGEYILIFKDYVR